MKIEDLNARLHDQPFKPFRIKTTLNNVYEIAERWMIFVTESSAVIALAPEFDKGGHPFAARYRTVALSHMVELEDIAPSKGSAKGSGKRSA